MVRQRVHGEGPQAGVLPRARPGEVHGLRGVQRLSGAGLVAEYVGAERAARGIPGDARGLVQREQRARRRAECGAGVERDRSEVEIDAVQGPRQRGHGHAVRAHAKPQRGDAVLQVREHGLVGAGGVGARVALPDVPARRGVATGCAASNEGGEAGVAGGGRGVTGGVQRAGGEPVLECGGQRFLGGRPRYVLTRLAQHAFHKALPLLMGRIRELGGQGEPVVRQDRHALMLGANPWHAVPPGAVTLPSSELS
ncbi:hypothetical protein SALBM135S_06407 [Streptomyces alboniger]